MLARFLALVFVLITTTSGLAQTQPTMFQAPKSFVDLPPVKKQAPPPANGAVVVPETLLPPPAINSWCGAMELGLNGSEGNSQNFNFRYALGLKRKTDDNIFTFDLLYTLATINDIRTQNRLFMMGRDEWYLGGTQWGYFVDGSAEYDEFKAFDLRIATHAGVTYKFIDSGPTLLKGRAGAGISREFGGPNDDWIPELLFGGDWEHKVSDTCKVFASADFFPNITDLNDYRLQLTAGLEACLSMDHNLHLKLGIQDLYDSTPEGRRPNDLFYFITLMWKF